jgi:predicted GNAT family acetyltransferase
MTNNLNKNQNLDQLNQNLFQENTQQSSSLGEAEANLMDDDFNSLIVNFLESSELLIRVLNKETKYFRDNKIDKTEKLLEHKSRLVDELEEYKEKVMQKRFMLEDLSESLREKVKETFARLKAASEENYNEALKLKEINKIVMDAVTYAVKGNNTESLGYSKYGKLDEKNSNFDPIALRQDV